MHEDIAPEDYVISVCGPLGSMYFASQMDLEFATFEEVETAIREHMELEQFWPNVWMCDDHGGISLMVFDENNELQYCPEGVL